ncbi:MAG: trimethylamine methyltransferase family protein, partial [Ilumatobacteraceae bacterium]
MNVTDISNAARTEAAAVGALAPEVSAPEAAHGRRVGGGRAARQAARSSSKAESVPFITRTLAPFEVLGDESIALIEENADTILERTGVWIRGYPRAIELFVAAGAQADGERLRFPRGLCRSLVTATAPARYIQHGRNPARNVEIGGMTTVFAPNYGSPFVRDLDNGRRYATLADFQNIVKLAYSSPYIHHSGGTVCEPVDVPVNKRHLDMVYSHI